MPVLDHNLVREVSRSFSISLQLLPGPMRGPVSLAYLLARASDTIADTADVPADERMQWLDGFIAEIRGGEVGWRRDIGRFSEKQSHAGERRLMERLDECFAALDQLSAREQAIVREVIDIITGGQRLDVERFSKGAAILPDAASLEDYCWRVAGCVGAFWTKIGFETLGERFSSADAADLETRGIAYGKGLQLVNILRDLPGDLKNGRCYLPVAAAQDHDALLKEASKWRKISREWLMEGKIYSKELKVRRLRAASVLPALLGEKTLDLLDTADWARLQDGVKITRACVRRSLLRALLW
ncbi:squalene/phytoene synthase family protein [Haloferula chungangensis]|uniref:Squalene/phytoene synthase family protein n=1 Tax=Haloferula chungangensis TaxID=1048331 RepID=A0ABW2LBA8_9BACT